MRRRATSTATTLTARGRTRDEVGDVQTHRVAPRRHEGLAGLEVDGRSFLDPAALSREVFLQPLDQFVPVLGRLFQRQFFRSSSVSADSGCNDGNPACFSCPRLSPNHDLDVLVEGRQ